MTNSKELGFVDAFGELCGDFTSVAKTIRFLEDYMDSPANPLPPDKTEEELNRAKAFQRYYCLT